MEFQYEVFYMVYDYWQDLWNVKVEFYDMAFMLYEYYMQEWVQYICFMLEV